MQDSLETGIRHALIERRTEELSYFRMHSKGYKGAVEEYLESSLKSQPYQTIRFLSSKLTKKNFVVKRTRSESKMIYESFLFLNPELFSPPNGFHSGVYRVLSDPEKERILLVAHKNSKIVDALHSAVQVEGRKTALSDEYVSKVTKQFYEDEIDFISYNQLGFLETNFMMIDVYDYLCGVKGIKENVAAENLLSSIKQTRRSRSLNAMLRDIYHDYLFAEADKIWRLDDKHAQRKYLAAANT
jgi:hypothetical protein